MKITIGSDHRGYKLKEFLKKNFHEHEWIDVGTYSEDRVDYPIFAQKVCENILGGQAQFGVLICGSGVGISIAANRFSKIYAALCWSPAVARSAREHDNSNVLVFPANFVLQDEAAKILEKFLETNFLGGRYKNRLEILDKFSD
jgi:ribose 5-phosphate isomerase B